MSYVKQFRISASLREKGFDLLTRYNPSDLAYTLGASFYDRMNKLHAEKAHAHSKLEAREMERKEALYLKASKRFVAMAKSLKMLEM
jgi:hypothetical protein